MHFIKIITIAAILFSINGKTAKAHVDLDYPLGGEIIKQGVTINIKWHVAIMHEQNNWDLYFSKDGGISWTVIATDLPVSQMQYAWLAPQEELHNGRIKIVQDNKNIDYESISKNFTISSNPSVSVEEVKAELNFSNYPNPFYGSTNFSFTLSDVQFVRLEIYNISGVLETVLINKKLKEGYYSVKWNAKQHTKGEFIYIFKTELHTKTGRLLHLN